MATISKISEERIKLDLYDKKIIFYLSQDSRMQISDIAKVLKLSPQRVKYKIERLKNELLSPAMFANFPLLNIKSYIIFTNNLNEKSVENLFSDESVYFIMQSIGQYQWAINVVTNDITEFCNRRLLDNQFEIQEIIKTYADNYNPFSLNIKPKEDAKDGNVKLDRKDYIILSELSRDSTSSLLDLQEKTKIDRQTIKQRIHKFTQNNIIQKFRYSINLFKIGFSTYLLNIKTSPANKKKILKTIREDNLSGFVFETINGFVIHYLPNTHNKLFSFITKLESIDSAIKIDVSQNTERFKVNLVPESVVKIFESRIGK